MSPEQRRELAGMISPSAHIQDWMNTRRHQSIRNANGVATRLGLEDLSDHSSDNEPVDPTRDIAETHYRCAPGCGCAIHALQQEERDRRGREDDT